MGFAVMGLATAFAGFTMRRTSASAFAGPLARPALLTGAGAVLTVAATELDVLQRWLLTTSLTGEQWLICLGLALVFPVAVELEKAWRRMTSAEAAPAVAVSVA